MRVVNTLGHDEADAFFSSVIDCLSGPRRKPVATSIVITHLLPDGPAFLRAVAEITDLRAVLPKPKSVDRTILSDVSEWLTCDELSREMLATARSAVAYLESRVSGERVVLLDVGGYFAAALSEICSSFSGQVLGVVEDTENGLRRYLKVGCPPCPVFSVARSPLKEPEDCLVGRSVVSSTETILRGRGDVLHGHEACVIGFGKLGSSIARDLHARHVRVTVYDRDPVRLAYAGSQGFGTARRLSDGLIHAGIVMCATGGLSLRAGDFMELRNGAYVASVTSSEDELDLEPLRDLYERSPAGPHVVRYSTAGHYFHVLNDGNAVNFLHGASAGPYIRLVQAEIVAAVVQLVSGESDAGIREVASDVRRAIAARWMATFKR